MPKISFDKVKEQLAKLNEKQLHDLLDATFTEINKREDHKLTIKKPNKVRQHFFNYNLFMNFQELREEIPFTISLNDFNDLLKVSYLSNDQKLGLVREWRAF